MRYIWMAQAGTPGGLSTGAHIAFALLCGAVVIYGLSLVRRRQLLSRYALIWFVVVVPLGVLAAFPRLLDWLASIIGVNYPPALFLLAAVVFLFLVVMQFSWDLSRLFERTRALAEEVALLAEDRMRARSDDEEGPDPA